jgi:hypothetical protein
VPNPDSLGSRDTCPVSDQRLPSTRKIAIRDLASHKTLTSPNTEPRTLIGRDPMASSLLSFGTHSAMSLRDFADRESLTQSSLLLETPNAETPILRIHATYPSNDRRLPQNREIAIRDFDVHATLALANPDMPKCDGKRVSLALGG